jgi:hypothetical protein
MRTLAIAATLLAASPAAAQSWAPWNWNVPIPGRTGGELDAVRAQQQQQAAQAHYQALQAQQYQLRTDQRLAALEQQRLQGPPPPPAAPISGGQRLQPTRDQAPQSQAAAPVQPSAAPPSDARTRGNLPL